MRDVAWLQFTDLLQIHRRGDRDEEVGEQEAERAECSGIVEDVQNNIVPLIEAADDDQHQRSRDRDGDMRRFMVGVGLADRPGERPRAVPSGIECGRRH